MTCGTNSESFLLFLSILFCCFFTTKKYLITVYSTQTNSITKYYILQILNGKTNTMKEIRHAQIPNQPSLQLQQPPQNTNTNKQNKHTQQQKPPKKLTYKKKCNQYVNNSGGNSYSFTTILYTEHRCKWRHLLVTNYIMVPPTPLTILTREGVVKPRTQNVTWHLADRCHQACTDLPLI